MPADEFYNGKPWIDLSEPEQKKGLETLCGGNVQQTSECILLPPNLPYVENGYERAGRQDGVHAKACPAKIPC